MRNSFRRCGGPLTRRSKNLYENVLTFPDIFNLFHVSSDTCTCKIYFKSFLIEFQRVFTISFWNQCVKISNLSVYLRCIYVLRRKKKIKRWCWTKPYFSSPCTINHWTFILDIIMLRLHSIVKWIAFLWTKGTVRQQDISLYVRTVRIENQYQYQSIWLMLRLLI